MQPQGRWQNGSWERNRRRLPAPTITIERDEPGKEEETQTAESESLPPESQSEAAREEIEGIVKKELETFDWTRDKVEGMNQVLQEIGREADQSVVTVSSVKHQVDWFDNPVESTGPVCGDHPVHKPWGDHDPDRSCGGGGGGFPPGRF